MGLCGSGRGVGERAGMHDEGEGDGIELKELGGTGGGGGDVDGDGESGGRCTEFEVGAGGGTIVVAAG